MYIERHKGKLASWFIICFVKCLCTDQCPQCLLGSKCSANPQLNSLSHQPTTSLHFTLLHFASLNLTANWTGKLVFNVTLRRGPHEKRCSSIVACVFVSAGMCLRSHCLEMGCIIPLFYCCVLYLATAALYRVTV
jgi:hypothetical protein